VRTSKKALVAELTAALAPVLTPQGPPLATLPKNIEQAVEHLAETILRWQTKQQKSARPAARSSDSLSEASMLTQLMGERLHEEDAEETDTLPSASETDVDPGNASSAELTDSGQKRRPRLSTSTKKS